MATAATCRCRLRCAINVLAASATIKYTEWQAEKFAFDDEGNQADHDDDNQQRRGAGQLPRPRTGRFAIERAVEFADQAADPGHRMADGARQRLRITEAELDQHGEKRKRDGHVPL